MNALTLSLFVHAIPQLWYSCSSTVTEETIIELIGENHILSQGSLAWIVADSTPYMYDPENGWVEQTNKTVMGMFDEFT